MKVPDTRPSVLTRAATARVASASRASTALTASRAIAIRSLVVSERVAATVMISSGQDEESGRLYALQHNRCAAHKIRRIYRCLAGTFEWRKSPALSAGI